MRVESGKPVQSGGWMHDLSDPLPSVAQAVKPDTGPPVNMSAEASAMFERGTDARKELAALLGVTAESLRLLGVGRGVNWDGRLFWSFPERRADGRVTGIVRRFDGGEKKTMKGSRSGLYFEPHWRRHIGPIFLPEGGSDTAALITLGISAIGRPSNIGGVKLLIAMLRRDRRRVIVLGEADEKPERRGQYDFCRETCKGCGHCFPGKFGAVKTAESLRVALGKHVSFAMTPDGAKDVREWLKMHGEPGGWRKWLSAIRGTELEHP